jgi:hypothetical protein
MMDPPMRRIMACRHPRWQVLPLRPAFARFACDYVPEEDLDWDEVMARNLIDAVLEFCGSHG